MKKYRIDLQYDGVNYSGWQIQKNSISIQEKIEEALFSTSKRKIKIIGAGRTDAKVHAIHQVASFSSNLSIPEDRLHLALNSKLPSDIRILKTKIVNESFHARFSAVKRTYKYVICDSETLSPFDRLYSWHRKKKLDKQKLLIILKTIIGKHDFSNLCSVHDGSKSKIREVFDIKSNRESNKINIFISANSFLRKMVRIIIGTAIKSIENNLGDDLLYKLLSSKERSDIIYSAPPQGLFLYKIEY